MKTLAQRFVTAMTPLVLVAALVIAASSQQADTSRTDVVAAPVGAKPVFTTTLPRDFEDVIVTIDSTSAADSEMSVGDSVSVEHVPEKSIRLQGRTLTLTLAPTDVPVDRIDDDGVVTFTVEALDVADHLWTTGVSVQMIVDDTGELAWVDALSPSALAAAEAGNRSLLNQHARKVPPGHDVANDRAELPELVELPEPVSRSATSSSTAEAGRAGENIAASDLSLASSSSNSSSTLIATTRTWTTVGTTYPLGASTAKLRFDAWRGHELGVAVSASGDYGSWKQSYLKKTSDGWSFEKSALNRKRSYRIEMSYGKYRSQICGPHYCTIRYRWKPRGAIGGFVSPWLDTRPSWKNPDYCTRWTGKGRWVRHFSEGKAYRYGAAVKMKSKIGINLGISRQYANWETRKAKHVYYIRNANPKIMCGNNHWPTRSGKQVERYRDSVW